MMVETILESTQDFGAGMPNGSLPQWKRELLQRRAARTRPPAAAAPPPPPPPPPPQPEEDEELSYGPGIVKRLKSRYLSLALRDAPRRRPSVLRRATSLEHLLDERPPPAPRVRAPRPASLAAAPQPEHLLHHHRRRDSVKRARSVDALSRLDSREDVAPPSPSPPPPPRPPALRPARVPRRMQPLLRETERPPPDVVRSTLRKFESAPPRRPASAARRPAVLRGAAAGDAPRRSLSPDGPEIPRSPSPEPPPPPPDTPPPAEPEISDSPVSPVIANLKVVNAPVVVAPPKIVSGSAIAECPTDDRPAESTDEVEGCAASRVVSRAALEEIARAGSSVRYAFPGAPAAATHLPPLAATNSVLLAAAAARPLRRVGVIRPMPAARPEPIAIAAADPPPDLKAETRLSRSPADRETTPPPRASAESPERERAVLVNGHSTPEPGALSRIGAAGIERAWSGSAVKKVEPAPAPAWLRAGGGGGTRARAPPAAATSVVFNFSSRKEVPDYIENDGIILRATRRNRIKAGTPGVVVLRPEALATGSDSEGEGDGGPPPSPCEVHFVNDNVLMNGRSSMPGKPNKDRIAKLKLQFDDSLTRTFEYPSETSLRESEPAPPAPAPAPSLADNTHMASAALTHYTPKSCAAAFQLGLTNPHHAPPAHPPPPPAANGVEEGAAGEEAAVGGAGGACGADLAKSWSEARAKRTDLLF